MALNPAEVAALERSLTNQSPSPAQVEQIEALREVAKAYGRALLELEPSRERSLALTHLEDSTMWAVKGIVLR